MTKLIHSPSANDPEALDPDKEETKTAHSGLIKSKTYPNLSVLSNGAGTATESFEDAANPSGSIIIIRNLLTTNETLLGSVNTATETTDSARYAKTAFNLTYKKMPLDGGCFFHALINSLTSQKCIINPPANFQSKLREWIINHIKKYREHYEGFIDSDINHYLEIFKRSTTWADHLTIMAAVRKFHLCIIVFLNDWQIQIFGNPNDTRVYMHHITPGNIEFHYNSLETPEAWTEPLIIKIALQDAVRENANNIADFVDDEKISFEEMQEVINKMQQAPSTIKILQTNILSEKITAHIDDLVYEEMPFSIPFHSPTKKRKHEQMEITPPLNGSTQKIQKKLYPFSKGDSQNLSDDDKDNAYYMPVEDVINMGYTSEEEDMSHDGMTTPPPSPKEQSDSDDEIIIITNSPSRKK
ncbi:MAG TPA: hypothetical protein VHZ76_00585 [Gammaproteobacteria bacterium]|jgi:hypothetical protein|nr:hypothetical protein [Gammaproteobacteria bacterium]